jgi:hypothetical protein
MFLCSFESAAFKLPAFSKVGNLLEVFSFALAYANAEMFLENRIAKK